MSGLGEQPVPEPHWFCSPAEREVALNATHVMQKRISGRALGRTPCLPLKQDNSAFVHRFES